MMTGSERRREPRFKGKLSVELESGNGITRDFSGSGIFFESDRPFSTGQPIAFTLILKNIDPEHPVRLNCLGEIIRVEESGSKMGVAVTLSSYMFEEFEPDIQTLNNATL